MEQHPIQHLEKCDDIILDCTKKLDAVLEVSESVKDVLHPNEVLNAIVTCLGQDLGYAFPMVFLFREDKQALILKKMGVRSNEEPALKEYFTHSFDKIVLPMDASTVIQQSIEEKSILITKQIVEFTKPFFTEAQSKIFAESGLNLAVSIPLLLGSTPVGALVLFSKREEFEHSEQVLLQTLANQICVAFHHADLFRQIERQKNELRDANQRLLELDRTKSEFISIASHQLRTPLTVIKGYLSLILEGSVGTCDPLAQEGLKKVAISANRLVSLVNDLLDISRIERGVFLLEKKPIRLELLAESVVDELSSIAKSKQVKLTFHRPRKHTDQVNADQEKIREVMANMIENAIKYSPQGKVQVSVKEMPAAVRFSVKDNGLGLSEDTMPKLFEKFSRGEGVSVIDTEGVGLGLFFAKRIIDEHGGRIWAESKGKNKGSTFCFELPFSRN